MKDHCAGSGPVSHWEAVTFFCAALLVQAAIIGLTVGPGRWERYDGYWLMQATRSLYYDGDLNIKNQLFDNPLAAWDQTAFGVGGEWYPVHEGFIAIAALPFYAAAGESGFKLFAASTSALTALLMLMLCRRHVSRISSYLAVMLTVTVGAYFPFARSYSIDIFGALLLLLPYVATLCGHYVLGGFWFGVAVIGRITSIATVPAFLLLLTSKRRLFAFLLGGLPMLLVFCFDNYRRFGGIATTSYQRWMVFQDGQLVLRDQLAEGFTQPFWRGAEQFFLSDWSGILVTMPLLPLVAVGVFLFRRKSRNEAQFFLLALLGYFFLTVKYIGVPGVYGDPAFWGNRYLLPVVVLSAVPLALAIDGLLKMELLGARRTKQ